MHSDNIYKLLEKNNLEIDLHETNYGMTYTLKQVVGEFDSKEELYQWIIEEFEEK